MAASENVQFSGFPRPGSLPTMTDGQFRQWAQLLEGRTGIVVPPERKSFPATSIALRMREIGYDGFQEYHKFLLARVITGRWSGRCCSISRVRRSRRWI